ncbi:FAD:protein FMN transferase [Pendulispora rubella]|uniref:FAD:protein FMN transferase n=1 Tax=Pendulispora rubella TaxID=2741070 RepID=A0ABZ2L1S6_9BACT
MTPVRSLSVASLLSIALLPTALLGCHERATPPAPPPRATEAVMDRAPSPPESAAAPAFAPEKVSGEGRAMGTHLAYAAYTTPKVDAETTRRAFEAATKEIQRLEALMTTWRPDSDLSRVNAAAGKKGENAVQVDAETFAVVQEAVHTSEISEGTFDITFESLHGLWKFDEDLDPHPPSDAAIRAKLPLVNYRHIHLDERARTIALDTKGVRISLGGIAKGYAVDRAAKVLEDAGLTSFYVQAGGDLYARGLKPDGSEWSAGVRDPRGVAGSYFALLPLSDHAFSTAGDYERAYLIGNKRFHHIIDPRTGRPATACRSVTIWAKTAFLADSIDDAVFILGPEKGMKLVESLDGVGAVIIDAKNNLWISKRLEGKLKITKPPTDGP